MPRRAYVTMRAQTAPWTTGSRYRAVIAVETVTGMPQAVFKFVPRPAPVSGTAGAPYYAGVCAPDELTDLPVGASVDGVAPYRLTQIDQTYESPTAAQTAYTAAKAAVGDLVDELNSLDALATPQGEWVGDAF